VTGNRTTERENRGHFARVGMRFVFFAKEALVNSKFAVIKTAQACHVFCEHQVLILWEVHEILSLFMKHLDYFHFNEFGTYPKDLLNCIGKIFDFERNLLLLDLESVF
jgi:hypothetical protein